MTQTEPPATHLSVDTFLPYMRDVIRCEHALQELNLMWRLIESSAKMNCPDEARAILPTMAATRQGFTRLEHELVSSLVFEKVSNVMGEIATRARYAIDILVRNLYERTADVGFLATDTVLSAFVAGELQDKALVNQRLLDYRNKYTVYDDIVLLDTRGTVLARINPDSPLRDSQDPLIQQALEQDDYVEEFRFSDLQPYKTCSLIYARRMLHPQTRQVIGVLCLCFNFEQEMAGIFASHGDAQGRSVVLLLNAENRVIESSDRLWIPLGVEVPTDRSGSIGLQMFSGREYLVRTVASEGYQSYGGPPGWKGQVMMPLEVAFSGGSDRDTLSELPQHIREGVLSHAKSFSTPLFEIMKAADNIRGVVWNGQVMSSGQAGDQSKLKAVLGQISETASRSNELFSKSIGDLYNTVLSSGLKQTEFVAHLLVDLLDRNLYERADDCRWWALTPELRSAMTHMPADGLDTAARQRCSAILHYINSLYTVYTRLFVYDTRGEIVASTRLGEADPEALGTLIDPQTLAAVRALPNDQSYFVTPFGPQPLYEGAATYIYHAAIRSDDGQNRVVGGVGIVFNSAVELTAMLQGGMGAQPQMTALFTDRNGHVIASIDPKRPVGSVFALSPDMKSLPRGSSLSRVVEHDGQYAVMACSASNGYREFKRTDGYQEDVLALVFDPIGAVRQVSESAIRADTVIEVETDAVAGDTRTEYATFIANGVLYALPAVNVLEAVSARQLASVPVGGRQACVGLLDRHGDQAQSGPVWVFRLNGLLHKPAQTVAEVGAIMVLEYQGKRIGLLVDELHDVREFSSRHIMPSPFYSDGRYSLIQQLIKANRGTLLIQALGVASLFSATLDAS